MNIDLLTGFIQDKVVLKNIILSVVFIVSVLLARRVMTRRIQTRAFENPEAKLRWHISLRNLSGLVIILGVISIWATQLETFAISAVAFIAALVLATKEIIMCISGGILRASSKGFRIGDRIEIGALRGEVIFVGFLTTTLLEIGPSHHRTGRAIVLPNSILLTQSVTNETFTADFVLHIVEIPIKMNPNWERAEGILLEAAQQISAPYLEQARDHLNRVTQRHALNEVSTEPKVLVRLKDNKSINLLVRFPTPAREKGKNEQELLRHFLRGYTMLDEAKEEAPSAEGEEDET